MVESSGLFHWTLLESTRVQWIPMDLSYLILVRHNNKLTKLLRGVTNKIFHFVQPAGSSHVTRSHVRCWLLLQLPSAVHHPPSSMTCQDDSARV